MKKTMSALSITLLLMALRLGFGASFAAPALTTGGETAAAWDAIGNFNPVVPGYFADPTLKKFGDTYYLYTSTDGIGACEGWTQVWISKDLVNWVNYKLNWNPNDKNWAPDCMEKGGKYYLFYNFPCMTFAAEGDSPVGPWRPYGKTPLVPDKFVPPVITLDFQSFQDDDGATYGYFTTWAGNNDAGSGWVKFNDDMKTFASKGRIPYHELQGIMEGPYMLKRNGKYYLMYSNASCHDETYNVRYSIHKTGPTADTGWIYGQNNPILSSDVPRKIHGTGHHSVLQENDNYFMIYHRHDIWVSAGGLTRQTCIDRMRFTADDQIEKVIPTHQGVGYFG
ncbi:MAG: family 43 glycosylhydrolase, partial [Verrucomicrobia bacterium]|nr:family 43 glycosylhydrolase [Verrucomicrobiota bacterium]